MFIELLGLVLKLGAIMLFIAGIALQLVDISLCIILALLLTLYGSPDVRRCDDVRSMVFTQGVYVPGGYTSTIVCMFGDILVQNAEQYISYIWHVAGYGIEVIYRPILAKPWNRARRKVLHEKKLQASHDVDVGLFYSSISGAGCPLDYVAIPGPGSAQHHDY